MPIYTKAQTTAFYGEALTPLQNHINPFAKHHTTIQDPYETLQKRIKPHTKPYKSLKPLNSKPQTRNPKLQTLNHKL